MCGLVTGCTTSQEYLSLAPDGKFGEGVFIGEDNFYPDPFPEQ